MEEATTQTAAPLSMVDTNVFVYFLYDASPQHAGAQALLNQARQPDAKLCMTPQVMTEFYSTITNPRRVSPAYAPETALQEVEKFLALPGLFLLSIPASVVVRWVALARQYGISQSDIFDAQLAATMLEDGIRRIYTFNVQDFERFDELEVVVPAAP
jgi:toxin-antitoxin system PIN domain toxin